MSPAIGAAAGAVAAASGGRRLPAGLVDKGGQHRHKGGGEQAEIDCHEAHKPLAHSLDGGVERPVFAVLVCLRWHACCLDLVNAMSAPDIEAAAGMKVLDAGPEAAGKRLDQWLVAALGPDFSRNRVQTLIAEGLVSVDGTPAREARRKLAGGERVELAMPAPQPAAPEAEAIPLDILYEDAELIVVNKPAGLVVHPGAGNWTGTLVNALLNHCGDSLSGIGGVRRPGIVHRLDKDTSGVMVVAKTDSGAPRAFGGLCRSRPQRPAGAQLPGAGLGQPATADRDDRRAAWPRRRPGAGARSSAGGRDDARHAVTHYRLLERFGRGCRQPSRVASLVECRLETGRTHQIRVHMAHIGHPLVGDPDYGTAFRSKANRLPEPLAATVRAFPRQALHAGHLAFLHPATHMMMAFEAPIPGDMQGLIDGFRKALNAP